MANEHLRRCPVCGCDKLIRTEKTHPLDPEGSNRVLCLYCSTLFILLPKRGDDSGKPDEKNSR